MLVSNKNSKCFASITILFVLTIFFFYWLTWFSSSRKTEPNLHVFTKRLPKAIIIGSNKSGTRALLVFLKVHPDIRACSYEVHFFDRDENYSQGLEWYRQSMPKSFPHQLTIEKTPAYFLTEQVPKRIFSMSKDVKLLVIVRDPTERAISDYTQLSLKSTGSVLPPFEEYVLKDENVINESRSVVKFGLYIKYLKQWMKYFPLSQIHFVSGENLVQNPAAELKLIEKFLNLRPMITEKNFYFNKTKGFPCFIGKIGLHGKRKRGCLGNKKGRKHVPVRNDVRAMLRDYYRPFNEELYKVVGRNFHWP